MTKIGLNYVLNTLLTVLNIGYPLLTMPIATNALDIDGMGRITFILATVTFVTWISNLGIPAYGFKEVARVRYDKPILESTVSTIFTINLVSVFLGLCSLLLVLLATGYLVPNAILVAVIVLQLAAAPLTLDWFFVGTEDIAYVAKRNLVIKSIFLFLFIVLVRDADDLYMYAFLQSMAVVVPNIVNVLYLQRKLKLRLSLANSLPHLRALLVTLLSSIATTVYTQLDKVMLGMIAGERWVAIYVVADRVVRSAAPILYSFNTICVPQVVAHHHSRDFEERDRLIAKELSVTILLSLPLVIGLVMCASDVIAIFGRQYTDATLVLQVFSAVLLFTGLQSLYGSQLLYSIFSTRQYLISICFGAGVAILGYVTLISYFGALGCALATAAAEGAVLLLQIAFVRQHMVLKVTWPTVAKYLAPSCVLFLALWFLTITVAPGIVRLAIAVPMAVVVYVCALLVFQRQFVVGLFANR